jgi:proteasome accessory factor A
VAERLFGLETEYAIVPAPGQERQKTPDERVELLRTRARALLPGLSDPGSSGVFLANGSRFYVDCGHHPEWTTPEVANPWDAVRYILAGERWLTRLCDDRSDGGGPAPFTLFKTNVDYTSGVSWGCHESVLYRLSGSGALAGSLMPLLVTRIIFTGAGGFHAFSPGIEFVLSPRAMFLNRESSPESTCNRGIAHEKQEHLCSHGFRRWHLVCGESLNSEIAMWLKSATLVLAVSLVEHADIGASVRLASPVEALHALTRDPSCRVPLALAGGGEMTALEIQRYYLEQAERRIGAEFMPPWTATACAHWRAMLDRLESAPGSVATTLDWAIKRSIFGRILARRNYSWDLVRRWNEVLAALRERVRALPAARDMKRLEDLMAPPEEVRACQADLGAMLDEHGLEWAGLEDFARVRRELFEADARFNALGPDGLFAQLDRDGVLTHRVRGVDNVEHAMEYPPAVGRAAVRGAAIRRLMGLRGEYAATWAGIISRHDGSSMDLSHPFETEERWKPAEETADVIREPAFLRLEALAGRLSPARRSGVALELAVNGLWDRAERVLGDLLSENYEPANTLCGLARVSLLRPSLADAERHVQAAWALRATAPRYVIARTAWIRALLAMLTGADPLPWMGRLKSYLSSYPTYVGWTMEHVLDRFEGALTPEQHSLMSGLLSSLVRAGGGEAALQRSEVWRACVPVPLEFEERSAPEVDGSRVA